jgi:hypothetical protein
MGLLICKLSLYIDNVWSRRRILGSHVARELSELDTVTRFDHWEVIGYVTDFSKPLYHIETTFHPRDARGHVTHELSKPLSCKSFSKRKWNLTRIPLTDIYNIFPFRTDLLLLCATQNSWQRSPFPPRGQRTDRDSIWETSEKSTMNYAIIGLADALGFHRGTKRQSL